MRELPRWTAADGKRPVTVDGYPASSTNARTWTEHDAVKDRPHGIMLGGGMACIDLDQCVNRRGKVAQWAREIIDAVPDAVVERSLSKTGVHIFGLLPEAPGRRRGCAEIYSRERFIRTTEDIYRVGSIVDLAPAVTVIERLYRSGIIPNRKKEVVRARASTET